jgi:hypothetical protein
MADATHTLNIIIRVTDKAVRKIRETEKQIKSLGTRVQGVAKSIGKFQRALQGVLLGVGLSFLFTGMAIKRFFEGILKSLTSTFLTVMGETSRQGQQVNRLRASWEFLKFRIMSALEASGLWDKVIDWLGNIIDRITEWVNEHPNATAELVKYAAKAAIVGTIMMVLGQTLLGILGVATLIWGVVQLIGFLISGTVMAVTVSWLLVFLAILAALMLSRARLGSWGNVLRSLGNDVKNFLIKPFTDLLDMVSQLLKMQAALQEARGKFALAQTLRDAAKIPEELSKAARAAELFKLDEEVIPDTTREGLLDLIGLEGLNDIMDTFAPKPAPGDFGDTALMTLDPNQAAIQPTGQSPAGLPSAQEIQEMNDNFIQLNENLQALNQTAQENNSQIVGGNSTPAPQG